jgi:hypothetical protein
MLSLDISQLNTALGDYCRDNDQDLIRKMYLKLPFDRYNVLDNVTDETPLPKMEVSGVVRPAQPQNFISGTNNVKFTTRMMKVRGAEINVKLIPKEAINSYLGKFLKKGTDPYDMPFISAIMEDILASAAHEITKLAIWKGVWNANGTSASDVCDGFLKVITDAIAAGEISTTIGNMVATGAITATNVIDKVEMIVDGIAEEWQSEQLYMYVSPKIFKWYKRAYRAIYGQNQDYAGMEKTGMIQLDGEDTYLVREIGLSGSQRIVCTPKENAYIGVDSVSDYGTLRTELFERQIKLMGDAKLGTNFGQLVDCFVTNDQA